MAMIKADDLISFDPRFKNTKLILQIHDELVFEIDEKNLNYVTKKILEVMENVVSLEVALPVKWYLEYEFFNCELRWHLLGKFEELRA